MSGPHATDPPPSGPSTQPILPDAPPSSTRLPEIVIVAGTAQEQFSAALDTFVAAFLNVEAIGMAYARALDGSTVRREPRP